jgi:DnaJ-class molecular chaperone
MVAVTCQGCSGKKKVKCPLCNGGGEVQSKSAQDAYRRMACPGCQGVGHLVCRLCGGVGKVPDTPER